MNTYYNRLLPFVISFFFQFIVLFVIIIKNNLAVYGSNDDALIASFSTDASLTSDKDNWIFIKSLLSIPLSHAQNYLGDYGAYGFFLAFVIILSTSVVISLITFVKDKNLRKIFFLLGFLSLFPFFFLAVLNPTYTGAAIFSGAVGFGTLLLAILNHEVAKRDVLLVAGILISISYAIRFESFLLNLGFFMITFMGMQVINKKWDFRAGLLVTPLLIFFSFFLVNFAADKYNYASKDWQEFTAINDLRHQIHLRTAEYVLGNHLTEIGWSESDYGMFRKFSLADQEQLNVQKLEKALEVSEYTRGVEAILKANFKNELIFINYSYLSFQWLIFLLFFFVLVMLFLSQNKIRYLIGITLIVVLSLAINYVFAVSYHLPDRLTFNILFMVFVGFFMLALFLNINKTQTKSLSRTLPIISLSIFAIGFFWLVPENIFLRIEQNQKIQKVYISQQDFLIQQNSNNRYIGTGSRLIYAGQDPYHKFEQIGSPNQVLILGWHNLSPIWNTHVKNVGLNPMDFHGSLINSSNVYLVDNSDASSLLLDFYSQYSGEEIELQDKGFLGTDFYRLFKIKEKP